MKNFDFFCEVANAVNNSLSWNKLNSKYPGCYADLLINDLCTALKEKFPKEFNEKEFRLIAERKIK